MTRPTVFLSHSSRVRAADELAPGDTMGKHVARKEYLRALIDALEPALQARGLDVWVDSTRIEPSDEFERAICLGLAECSAAVILVDADALRSEYVRDEALMLGWRRVLEPDFQILPVLIGDISGGSFGKSPLARAGGLGRLSAMNITGKFGRTMAEKHAAEIAAKVHPGPVADTAARDWIDSLAHFIELAPATTLDRAAEALGISAEAWARSSRTRPRTLAAALLHSDLVGGYKVLTPTARYMGHANARQAARQVSPLWVRLSTAREVFAVTRLPNSKRRLTVGTSTMAQAEHAVLRASAGSDLSRTIKLSSAAGEHMVNELVDEFDVTLRREYGLLADDTPADVQETLRETGNIVFALIAVDEVDPGVMRRVVRTLISRFPGFVFLLVADTDGAAWSAAGHAKTALSDSPEDDRRARRYISMTDSLIRSLKK